jgi:MFS family permease
MTSTRQSGRIYYGWWLVGICMVSLMLTVGTTMNAFGLYILPVSAEFHLSRATMNTGLILMNAGSALSALVIGRLIDRFPARVVMGAGGYLLAGSLVGLGLSHDIRLSAILLALPLGMGMSGLGNLTSPTLVTRWFVVHRARALAITMMGMSIATIFVAPPIAMLIDWLGWRGSLIAEGCILAAFVTVLLPFVRNAPEPGEREAAEGQPAQGDQGVKPAADAPALSVGTLLSRPLFWAIGLSTAIAMAIFQGSLVSLIPIARELGFSTTKSATLISMFGIAGIAGKLIVAWLADRLDRALALSVLFALLAVGCAVAPLSHSFPALAACALMIGLPAGAGMPLYMALLADRFGSRSFGTGSGVITFAISVLGAIAVRFSGEVFDRTGGYQPMFMTFCVLGSFAALLVLTARRGNRRHPTARATP